MQLPERLRNLGIVPYNPDSKEKIRHTLSESKMKSMEEIFVPLLDKKAGA